MKILKCNKCFIYTLKETCPKCKTKTLSPKPAKYSPLDPYGKWRRIYKRNKNDIQSKTIKKSKN